MNKKAIVTLAIGDKYIRLFNELCRKNWESYCEMHNYDLIVINQKLDLSARAQQRSPAWQKLLICSQEWSSNYQYIVWMDADILINLRDASDICAQLPQNKVSAVDAWSIPSHRHHKIGLENLYTYWDRVGKKYVHNLSPESYYRNRGIHCQEDMTSVMQTGVFVCSPKFHKDIFEHIYFNYEDEFGPEYNYEMPAMSYELINNNFHNWIDPKFNWCVTDIASSYYPFLFHGRQNRILNSLSHRAKRALGYDELAFETRKLQALESIFLLGQFVHFAHCAHWMKSVSKVLRST